MEENASMDIDWEDQYHFRDEIAPVRITRSFISCDG